MSTDNRVWEHTEAAIVKVVESVAPIIREQAAEQIAGQIDRQAVTVSVSDGDHVAKIWNDVAEYIRKQGLAPTEAQTRADERARILRILEKHRSRSVGWILDHEIGRPPSEDVL